MCGVRPPTRSSLPSCSRPSRTLRAADAVARRRAILDRHCARRHEARAGRGGRMVPIEPKDGTRAGVDWWVSVKGLTPTPPSEPLKPSTGAAVRDHRNAVRDRSESLSAIDRNHCPHSPESAITHRRASYEAVLHPGGTVEAPDRGNVPLLPAGRWYFETNSIYLTGPSLALQRPCHAPLGFRQRQRV